MPLPDNVPPPPKPPMHGESALKETYLQLLPHPVLVSLVLALDRNHDAVIWPTDLPSAIDSLREYAKRLYAPSKTPIAPIAPAALPPSVGPSHPHSPNASRPAASPGAPIPAVPPTARHLPTQIVPRIPQPGPGYASGSSNGYAGSSANGAGPPGPLGPPGRIPPPRNQTGRPPNGPGSGGMPSYEEMIVIALQQIKEPEGLAPKTVFDYMSTHWSLMNNFRPSASQALQKAYKRGRLEKVGGKYRLNPNWEGGNTSKRTTRRPQMGDGEPSGSPPGGASSSTHYPFPWSRPTTIPGSTSARYPTTSGKLFPGSLSSLPNRSSSSSLGGKGKGKSIDNLLRIKQESGDEDELEDDSDTNGHIARRNGNGNGVVGEDGNPPMTLRETLEKLAKLLAESVEHEQAGGDPAGAG